MDKVIKAIDLASGKNLYIVNGKPNDVIAHLFMLEGGTLQQLKQLLAITGIGGNELQYMFPLKNYPLSFLSELQFKWDRGTNKERLKVWVQTNNFQMKSVS